MMGISTDFFNSNLKTKIKIHNMLVESQIELKKRTKYSQVLCSLCHKTTQQLSQINTLVTWKKKSRNQRSGPYQKKPNSFRIIFMSDFYIRFVLNSLFVLIYKEIRFPGIHLLRRSQDLQFVSWILNETR